MSVNVACGSAAERGTGAVRRRNVSGSRAGSSATLNDALPPSISRHQHISVSKQQAAARGPVTLDPASGHPSVNGANRHATQLRNFTLRQKLFAPHTPSPSFDLRSARSARGLAARPALVPEEGQADRPPVTPALATGDRESPLSLLSFRIPSSRIVRTPKGATFVRTIGIDFGLEPTSRRKPSDGASSAILPPRVGFRSPFPRSVVP